jgi:hypothetical protein
MVTEILSSVIILAIGVLILGLLFIGIRAIISASGESGSAPKDRWISWYSSCYQPCLKDLGQTSDSCVMRCSWNSL